MTDCGSKLHRAEQLISGLGGEKASWARLSRELHNRCENIAGKIRLYTTLGGIPRGLGVGFDGGKYSKFSMLRCFLRSQRLSLVVCIDVIFPESIGRQTYTAE